MKRGPRQRAAIVGCVGVRRVVAIHEARQAYYAAHLTHALSRDVIERHVPARERKHVYRQLEDIIETLIEMDTIQFGQLVDL